MEIFGIHFAPLNVPLERRLQTVAVAAWLLTMVPGGIICFCITIYLILFTGLRWLLLLYLFWIWIDKDIREKGGRSNEWMRSWGWWRYYRDYFPLRFEQLPGVELDPKKNYLFCCFPHGIICAGIFNAFGYEYSGYKNVFPHHKPHVVTVSLHYVMPFFRELALGLGGIIPSAKSIDYVLSTPGGGHVCVLIVGGVAETYIYDTGCYNLFLKKRKGFVRIALKNGTPLVPVLSFGETNLFGALELTKRWRGLIPPRLPIGRGFFQYSFGLLPHRSPVTTVVGKPMEIPKIEEPTTREIDEYHGKFIEKLIEMFEEQKYNYLKNPEDTHLNIE